jgi:hypothetical protein
LRIESGELRVKEVLQSKTKNIFKIFRRKEENPPKLSTLHIQLSTDLIS